MHRGDASATELSEIAEQCLGFLAGDLAELERFMALSGHSPASLRAALGSEELAHGLLSHFVSNEALLLALCANAGLAPGKVTALWQRIDARGEA